MSAYEPEPDRVWDEYEWERFLQQQDHKTEKYMELLEKYLDHPQRDQIIAREMGWTQLLNEEGESCCNTVNREDGKVPGSSGIQWNTAHIRVERNIWSGEGERSAKRQYCHYNPGNNAQKTSLPARSGS